MVKIPPIKMVINHPFLMVKIPPKNGDEWGMVYGIAIPTLVFNLHFGHRVRKKSSCTRGPYHCFTRTVNPDFQTEGEFMLRGGIERYVRTFPEGGFWKAQGLGSPFCSLLRHFGLPFTSCTRSKFYSSSCGV